MDIVVIGPGKTSLEVKLQPGEKSLAFQATFPHCYKKMSIIPDYWVSGDPNAYVEGFQYLLQLGRNQKEKFKNMKILIPDIFCNDLAEYRKYCGTTPLMRIQDGWGKFLHLTELVKKEFNVEVMNVTTTKYIKLYENLNSDYKNIFKDEFFRFMSEKVIFGTVEFDSESVIGDTYKWGLENKLTSVVLPVCYYLRAKTVKVYGFDFQGPRFYSDIERHPWNDETQSGKNIAKYPLKIVEKWLKWRELHGMNIVSPSKDPICLLTTIL